MKETWAVEGVVYWGAMEALKAGEEAGAHKEAGQVSSERRS